MVELALHFRSSAHATQLRAQSAIALLVHGTTRALQSVRVRVDVGVRHARAVCSGRHVAEESHAHHYISLRIATCGVVHRTALCHSGQHGSQPAMDMAMETMDAVLRGSKADCVLLHSSIQMVADGVL